MAKELSTPGGNEIAKRLHLNFVGDVNPIDHGGIFYATADWEQHGQVQCISFYRPDENGSPLIVECGTIHKPNEHDMVTAFRCCGWEIVRHLGNDTLYLEQADGEHIDRTPTIEIECTLAAFGFEPLHDMSGPLQQVFPEGKDGWINKSDVWKRITGWLISLAK